jgi:rhodanese-related sulfurtransferase
MGLKQDDLTAMGLALTCEECAGRLDDPDLVLIDLRDNAERRRKGVIPGSIHAPYPDLDENVHPGGMLHELAKATGKRLVFYCAYGERSAMAVQAATEAGLDSVCHITGGLDAWHKAGGPVATS